MGYIVQQKEAIVISFIVENMVWSFSRLNSFSTCPYEWKRNYIDCESKADNFFAQYGSLIHKILEKYSKNELSIFEISQYYEDNYYSYVTEPAPKNKFVDIASSYFNKGLDYLDNIDLDIDEKMQVLGIEKKVDFKIDKYPMIGYIDLLLKDKSNGEITILDHKSGSLKFKKNGELSKTSIGHFESFKRQLYLYSIPVIKEYGRVDWLEWNLFKDRKHYRIPWKKEEMEEAIKWALDVIHTIENEEYWRPSPDFYYCNNLCSQRKNGCEYKP